MRLATGFRPNRRRGWWRHDRAAESCQHWSWRRNRGPRWQNGCAGLNPLPGGRTRRSSADRRNWNAPAVEPYWLPHSGAG